jgi:phosphatidylglycerophosphate synthase
VLHARDLGKLKTWAQAVAAGLGGLAVAGAFNDAVAWWALLVALVLTWVSGLDYARLAPGLLRPTPTAQGESAPLPGSPAVRQRLR